MGELEWEVEKKKRHTDDGARELDSSELEQSRRVGCGVDERVRVDRRCRVHVCWGDGSLPLSTSYINDFDTRRTDTETVKAVSRQIAHLRSSHSSRTTPNPNPARFAAFPTAHQLVADSSLYQL